MFKRISSEAAAKKQPQAYPLRYVEDCFKVRTKLEAFFNILLPHIAYRAKQLPHPHGGHRGGGVIVHGVIAQLGHFRVQTH